MIQVMSSLKSKADPHMPRLLALIFSLCCWSASLGAADFPIYTIRAGDILQVSVWKEEDLQLEVLVRPDGGFSLPLVGEVQATGKTTEDLRKEITKRLSTYVPDAVVTVAVRQTTGNKIYVLGKVNKPGEFLMNRSVDVMQALSMAGGASPFADVNDIRILRREGTEQRAMEFKYDQVSRGKRLEQNIILQSGDVVVVP